MISIFLYLVARLVSRVPSLGNRTMMHQLLNELRFQWVVPLHIGHVASHDHLNTVAVPAVVGVAVEDVNTAAVLLQEWDEVPVVAVAGAGAEASHHHLGTGDDPIPGRCA